MGWVFEVLMAQDGWVCQMVASVLRSRSRAGDREREYVLVYAAVAEVLAQLEIGLEEMRSKLEAWRTPEVFDTMGVVTGATCHCFTAQKAGGGCPWHDMLIKS